MGLFNFFKGGVDVDDIQSMLAEELDNQIRNLKVEIYDTRADLFGECDAMAIKEKAILLAGNVEGIDKVNAYHLKVPEFAPATLLDMNTTKPDEAVEVEVEATTAPVAEAETVIATPTEAVEVESVESPVETSEETEENNGIESQFYQIQSGDSLWKIAQHFYGDGNKYQALFEENREVIKDPDKVYPGQMIRVPKL